jgi:hypothetical protein
MPLEVAAEQIRAVLSGMVSNRQIFIAQLGLQHEQLQNLIKQGQQGEVLRLIMEALRRQHEMAAAGAELWEAKVATVLDILKKIRRTMGEELFNAAKKTIGEFEQWYSKNQAGVRAWAKEVGTHLVEGFKTAVALVKEIAEHWSQITIVVKTLIEYWLAKQFIQALTRAIELVAALRAGMQGVAAATAAAGAAQAAETVAKGSVLARLGGWVTMALGTVLGLKAAGEYLQTKTEQEAELIRTAKITFPALYEEARRYAEARAETTIMHGERVRMLDTTLIAKYIQEQWEAAVKAQEGIASTVEELSEQSSMLAEFFRETAGQTFQKAMTDVTNKMTAHPPVIDMKNSKIEIKMDVRHLDPDRVAAAVLTGLSRAAVRKVSARTTTPYSVTG